MKTIIISVLLLETVTGCQTPSQKFNTPVEIPNTTENNRSLDGTARQSGGANSVKITSNGDVEDPAIGAYDEQFVSVVKARWDQLWDGHSPNGSGKVVLEFTLHPDGRITGMKMIQSEVSDLMVSFCKQAVLDPAPFIPWPPEMRVELPNDYRDMSFTFYYWRSGDKEAGVVSKPSATAATTSTSPFGSAPSPTGFRSFSWGDSPTGALKKTASNPDGSAMYVAAEGTKPEAMFNVPVAEEAFMFSNGRFYGGMAWLDGRENFEKIKAALVRRYGEPSFANPRILLWKWKWQDGPIEVSLYYEERFARTTVSLENNKY